MDRNRQLPEGGALAHEVVELRVHGVSGTSAEELLDHPVVIRVAGDDNAGFYRPRPGFGASDRPDGFKVEAYRWGALTAGAAARTLSLLFLLPFMLVNLAAWARPPTGGTGEAIGPLCRLLAATLTAAFVLSVAGLAVDLVGWQCVSYRPCLRGRGYLSWLAMFPLGPRLALLALAPIAALRLLWWLGKRSARMFEAFSAARGQDRSSGGEDRIDRPGFWNDALVVQRLRTIHLAIGLGTLATMLLGAQIHLHPTAVAYVLYVLAWLLLVAGVVLLCLPARIPSEGPGRGRPSTCGASGPCGAPPSGSPCWPWSTRRCRSNRRRVGGSPGTGARSPPWSRPRPACWPPSSSPPCANGDTVEDGGSLVAGRTGHPGARRRGGRHRIRLLRRPGLPVRRLPGPGRDPEPGPAEPARRATPGAARHLPLGGTGRAGQRSWWSPR